MSRWQSDQIEQKVFSFDRVCFCRQHAGDVRGDNRFGAIANGLHSLVFRVLNFITVCALIFIGWGVEISRAQQTDFGAYARAVEFCRGTVRRPMALDLDKRVLCFDGPIFQEQNIFLANQLAENGLFVIRSYGGSGDTAMALADILRDRRATIVVYDYCLSACASYLLVASAETFVLKGTLVAWHNTVDPLCPSLEISQDGGPKRLEKLACSDSPLGYQIGWDAYLAREQQFFETRAIHLPIEWPPESFVIRRILKSMFEGAGKEPYVLWTWHPRYYAGLIKTKISYEVYPESQAEIDAIVSRYGFHRVLYDP